MAYHYGKQMNIRLFILIVVLFQGVFCQSKNDIRFTLVEQRELGKSQTALMLGLTREMVFRVYNDFPDSMTVYGEKNDNEFDPEIDTVKWDSKTGKWLYSSGEETPHSFDMVKPEDKYVIKANQFLEFKVWMQIPCFTSQRKLAIYVKSKTDEKPKILLSDEFTTQNLSEGCSAVSPVSNLSKVER